MSARIHRNLPLWKLLLKAKPAQRQHILQAMSNELMLTLCEVTFNILSGTIPLSDLQYKKIGKEENRDKVYY